MEIDVCKYCGMNRTREGHDGCLGTLIGVMNACCGHGIQGDAYIQFFDQYCIRGKDAVVVQEILKKNSLDYIIDADRHIEIIGDGMKIHKNTKWENK